MAMTQTVVPIADREIVHGLMADYGGLLFESAYLLAAVAEAPATARGDEFDVLLEVASEGTRKHVQLTEQFPSPVTLEADWSQERALVTSVHDLFEVILRIGANLTDCMVSDLPAEVIQNVRLVVSVSRSLAHALEVDQDPAEAERCLWAARLGIHAMERQTAQLTSDLTGAADHQGSRPRAPA